jgi:hypothetical protein
MENNLLIYMAFFHEIIYCINGEMTVWRKWKIGQMKMFHASKIKTTNISSFASRFINQVLVKSKDSTLKVSENKTVR